MPFVSPDAWIPVGVDSLEPIADLVVRSDRNSLVLAGPGAGKTELLAQRACFLLETGKCAHPRRILAISFKRDAAKNLKARIEKRSGERAQLFDSFTLDAFAKGVVDRFRLALSQDWRPKPGYDVLLRGLKRDEIREWFISAGISRDKVQQKTDAQVQRIFDQVSHGHVLPYSGQPINETIRRLGLAWWREQLDMLPGTPSLSFPMLNRLAAFLLRTNPKLTAALRATYSFVFLDEFQDTTAAQYDLIRSAFLGSQSVLTAVGDSKQRIMLWAGAMADVFETYVTDFDAERHQLVSNYRSAPELVLMQHFIAQAVESDSPIIESKRDSVGSCAIWEFNSQEDEAETLAALIETGIREDKKEHRDFCILVRQRTSEMIEPLKTALGSRGIKLRDESQLQDLLVEPVAQFLLAILRLATRSRDPEAWNTLTHEIPNLFGFDQDIEAAKIEEEARSLLRHTRAEINAGRTLDSLPNGLVSIVGESRFRSAHVQYKNGSYLTEMVNGLAAALRESVSSSQNAMGAVDDLIGIDVVPAMTIHKSKGLEFDTVIFLGLEDSQWWTFSTQAEEEKRGFFVAFSRAIARVYFTFSDVRAGRWGPKEQEKEQIGALYRILLDAGVPTIDHRPQE